MIIYDMTSGYHFDVESGLINGLWKNKNSKRENGAICVERLETNISGRTGLRDGQFANTHILAVDALGVFVILLEFTTNSASPKERDVKRALRRTCELFPGDPFINDAINAALRNVGDISTSGESAHFRTAAHAAHPAEFDELQAEWKRLNRS